jgi:hypothetical protein
VALEISFSRTEYAAALAGLEASVEALRVSRGLAVILAPCDPVDSLDLERGRVPFTQYLTATRKRYQDWLEWCQRKD